MVTPAADNPGTPTGRPRSGVTRRDVLRGGVLGAAALAVPGLLGACDSGDSGGSGSSSGGKAKVRLWTWYTEQEKQWPMLAQEFQASHPNVVIENRVIDYDAYLPALQAAVSGGDPPEIFAPHVLAIEYGKAGIAADLKAELGADFLSDFFTSTNDEFSDGDKQYALGWMAQTFGIFYDPAVFARAKVDVPETWDDLVQVSNKVKSSTGLSPCVLSNNPGSNGPDFILPLITQAANDPHLVLDLDYGHNGARWDHPKVIEALTKVDQLIKGGAFAPNPNGIPDEQAQRLLYTGKAAMFYSGSWVPQGFTGSAPKPFLQRYKVMQTPAWAAGARHWCANQAGAGLSVSAKSKNKAAALEFIRFMYEPTRYAKVMNESNSMPSTNAAGAQVTDPVVKLMTSWLLNGDGAPHILFGKGSAGAATNAFAALIGGKSTPEKTAAAIQAEVEKARTR
jgi:ABC-type glycerol-3-phosphate transport system substrate-binding protein